MIKKPWKADKVLIDYLRESGAKEKKYSHSCTPPVKQNSKISSYDDLITKLYEIISELSKSSGGHTVDLVSVLGDFKKLYGQTVRNYLSGLSQSTSIIKLLRSIENIEVYQANESIYIKLLDNPIEIEQL